MMKATVALVAATLFSVTAAHALDRSTLEIKGKVNQTVKVEKALNVGIGSRVTAKQAIGAIRGNTKIGGDVTQKIDVKEVLNVGIGSRVKACQDIGVIGDASC